MPARVRNTTFRNDGGAVPEQPSFWRQRMAAAQNSFSDGNGGLRSCHAHNGAAANLLPLMPIGGVPPAPMEHPCRLHGNYLTMRSTQSSQAHIRAPCLSIDEQGL